MVDRIKKDSNYWAYYTRIDSAVTDQLEKGVSAICSFVDVDDIATLGPIIGQEYMKLRLTTPDLDEDEIDFTNTTFAIYKVVSRISGSQNAQLLTLSFTTPELLKNCFII